MWAAGIFGLIGVIVGSLLGAVMTLLLDGQRTRGEVRRAKLLVAGELHTIWAQLGILGERGVTPSPRHPTILAAPIWESQRSVLAGPGGLSDRDWFEISMFHDVAAAIRVLIDAFEPGSPFPENQVNSLGELASQADEMFSSLITNDG